MEPFKKPSLSFSQQCDLLASRGLVISDRCNAELFLSHVNYYRFSAYVLPFENQRHQFKPSITFEMVQQLYEFDRRLRFLIDEALEVVEISMRAAIAYYLSHRYGAFSHEEKSNFFYRFRHDDWINKVHEETLRSKETFIEHYKSKYEGFPALPIWMAVEVISFGALSQLFHSFLRQDQETLANKVGFHSKVLASWLHTFTYIRNICAHHSRLWNRELAIAMEMPTRDHAWTGFNAKRVGAVLFAINQFLAKLPINAKIRTDWRDGIEQLLSKPPSFPEVFQPMGLPDQFKQHPLWK